MKTLTQKEALDAYFHGSISSILPYQSISFNLYQGFLCSFGISLQRWFDLQKSLYLQHGLRPGDDSNQTALLFQNRLSAFGSRF